MNLESLQDTLNSIKKLEQPKWLSRKLLVTVGILIFLIWIGRDNISAIIWCLTSITLVWLVCTTVVDIFTIRSNQKINEKIVDALSKDGLTTEEIKEIQEIRENK